MIHMMLSGKYLNPNLTWCYGFEDLIGRMKKIAMASKSGLKTAQVSRTLFLKYRKVLNLAMKKEEQDL